jgi:hypothetical protein
MRHRESGVGPTVIGDLGSTNGAITRSGMNAARTFS